MANMRPLCQAMQVDKFIFGFKKQLSSATNCPPLELEGGLQVTFCSGWRLHVKSSLSALLPWCYSGKSISTHTPYLSIYECLSHPT